MKNDIEMLGEDRARRAGVILDVSSDGYYNSEKCIQDFVKVRVVLFRSEWSLCTV